MTILNMCVSLESFSGLKLASSLSLLHTKNDLGCGDTESPHQHNQTEQTIKRDLDDVVMTLT